MEEGAEESREGGCVWVSEAEFVKVVDVGDAEVEWREKGDASWGDVCENVEGD